MTMHMQDVLKMFVQLPFTATIWEEIIDTASSNDYPYICSHFSTIATVGVKNLELVIVIML